MQDSKAQASDAPRVVVRLAHLRVTEPNGTTLQLNPDVTSTVVGRLRAAGVCVSLAEVTTASGEVWFRVAHGVAGEGYISAKCVRQIKNVNFELGGMSDKFELMRAPRSIFPEPPRDPYNRDVTFTITFNGRLEPFFEAMGSVLRDLGQLGCIDAWIVCCDKGAQPQHREEILRALPWVTFIGKGAGLHCHPVSMNLLLACVRTKYWLQWEDDWSIHRPFDMLTRTRTHRHRASRGGEATAPTRPRRDSHSPPCRARFLSPSSRGRGVELHRRAASHGRVGRAPARPQ